MSSASVAMTGVPWRSPCERVRGVRVAELGCSSVSSPSCPPGPPVVSDLQPDRWNSEGSHATSAAVRCSVPSRPPRPRAPTRNARRSRRSGSGARTQSPAARVRITGRVLDVAEATRESSPERARYDRLASGRQRRYRSRRRDRGTRRRPARRGARPKAHAEGSRVSEGKNCSRRAMPVSSAGSSSLARCSARRGGASRPAAKARASSSTPAPERLVGEEPRLREGRVDELPDVRVLLGSAGRRG